jgi:DedD protein
MAELVVTQDELALRRRARRRLVGAVAIALTAIVALPMLFDSEPKPLGPEVDIRIPAQDAPFEPAPAVKPAAAPVASAAPAQVEVKPAEPTQKLAPVMAPAKVGTAPLNDKAKVIESTAKTEAKPEPVVSSEPEKDKTKPDQKPSTVKPVAEKPKVQPEPKTPLKPDSPFAAQGYFLQLGAFASESNARQLQEKASEAGFKAVMIGTNNQFRVRVGPIPQHDKAMELQAKLKAKGFSPVLLGP